MTAPGREMESTIREDQEAGTSSLPKTRRRLLKVLGIIATVMFFRHPAALSGAAGCFLFRGPKQGLDQKHLNACKQKEETGNDEEG